MPSRHFTVAQQEVIRAQLADKTNRAGSGAAEPSRSGSLASLRAKRDRLLALMLDGKISDTYFAEQERQLTTKINAVEADHHEAVQADTRRSLLADTFDRAAAMLRDPAFDLDSIVAERQRQRTPRTDRRAHRNRHHPRRRLQVTVTGAPPFPVTLNGVGLRDPGTGPVVSEDRAKPPRVAARAGRCTGSARFGSSTTWSRPRIESHHIRLSTLPRKFAEVG
jgi:hypothetical protein